MCVETLLNNVQIKGSSGGGERGTMWHSIRIWELCCYFLSYHPNLYKSLLILLLLDTNMPSFKKQMLRISFMPFLIVAFITNNRKIINGDQMLGGKKSEHVVQCSTRRWVTTFSSDAHFHGYWALQALLQRPFEMQMLFSERFSCQTCVP